MSPSLIPTTFREVFVAAAQKQMPQAPQIVVKLTFALDVC